MRCLLDRSARWLLVGSDGVGHAGDESPPGIVHPVPGGWGRQVRWANRSIVPISHKPTGGWVALSALASLAAQSRVFCLHRYISCCNRYMVCYVLITNKGAADMTHFTNQPKRYMVWYVLVINKEQRT